MDPDRQLRLELIMRFWLGVAGTLLLVSIAVFKGNLVVGLVTIPVAAITVVLGRIMVRDRRTRRWR